MMPLQQDEDMASEDHPSGVTKEATHQLQPQQQEQELDYLVNQYNDKILKISTAASIINVLPLLIYQIQMQPTERGIEEVRREYAEIISKTLQFQNYLINEFERKFEDRFRYLLLMDPSLKLKTVQELYNSFYNRISPLQANMGHLKSDIKKGLAKLFNMQ
jgi:hypothetical protein